jgi:hypothetical protein
MNQEIETAVEAEARKKADARASFWFGVIFAGMIVLMIAGMAAIDIYMDNVNGSEHSGPTDAADR